MNTPPASEPTSRVRDPRSTALLPETEPNVCAKYRGHSRLKDGSEVEIVEWVVQFANADYESHKLKFPAVRGHVWCRRPHIEDYSRAASAAVDIARQEAGCAGYVPASEVDPIPKWCYDLRRAVMAEFFLGDGVDDDDLVQGSAGWGTTG